MTDRDPWLHPDGGMAPWLRQRMAQVAREVAAEWGVRLGAPFDFARYSYAAPADDDKVLKVVPSQDDEGDHEADALSVWDGDGAVRLLRHDRARRALLIERAIPGHDAAGLDDVDATAIAVDLGRTLWRRAERGRPFRWIGDHIPRWLDNAGDHDLVPIAKRVYASLRVDDIWLVHGDFHHHNFLRHGERWVAIDPKPYVGEREFDVVTFFFNPFGRVSTRETLERRIAAFAAAGLDEGRIRKWAIVRGTYLGLPLWPGEREEDSPQLTVARLLVRSV